MANLTTITINGKVYEGKVDLVLSLISSGLITEVAKSEPKAEKKAKAEPKKAENKGKDEDWFDRDQYIALGEKFGAVFTNQKGQSKVYAWARPAIYAIMKGEISESKAKTIIKKAKKASDEKYGKKSA